MEKEDNRRVWLGITYTVPAKPSRARVYIWRKLKELGAEYYHGMAMVPQTPRLQESIKKLVARIRELGAEVSVLEIRFADPADEEKVVAQFRRQAENDFRELFLDFARLYEELGGPLDGDGDQRRILRRRYGKVKSRDFFHVAEEPDFSAFPGASPSCWTTSSFPPGSCTGSLWPSFRRNREAFLAGRGMAAP